MPREASWRQHRSNRAKHVDLIVPVVPFVTTDNARDVLIESMEGTNVSPGLLRLTARHVADMRTIHSLRNEFEATLPTCPRPRPGITRDIASRSCYCERRARANFGAIRLSGSSLDDLRKDQQKLIEENIGTQTARPVGLRTQRENGASHESRVALARVSSCRQLPTTVADQPLQPIPGRNPKILDILRRMDQLELPHGHPLHRPIDAR